MCKADQAGISLTNYCLNNNSVKDLDLLKKQVLSNHQDRIDELDLNTVYGLNNKEQEGFPQNDFKIRASPYFDTKNLIDHLDQHMISNDNFKVLNWNCNGMTGKINTLRALLHIIQTQTKSKIKFDAICLQEIKLDTDETIEIPGYKFIPNTRNSNGGGIGIYISEKFKYSPLETDPPHNITAQWKFVKVWVPWHPKNYKIIGSVYRPQTTPTAEFITQFGKQLELIKEMYKDVYACGDYNIDLIKSNTDKYSSDFLECMTANSFSPMITLPTRVTRNTATLIDNILTNTYDEHHTGILTFSLSDHYMTLAISKSRQKTINSKKTTTKRNFSEKNIANLITDLEKEDFSSINNSSNENFEENFYTFEKKVNELLNINIPAVKVKYNKYSAYRPNEPWVTKGIIQSIYNKDKMYRHMMSLKNEIDFHRSRSGTALARRRV